MKKGRYDDVDNGSEIESDGDDFFMDDAGRPHSNSDKDEEEELEETVDEKRIRLAQQFLTKLKEADDSDVEEDEAHEKVSEKLKRQYLLAKGRKKRYLAESLLDVDLNSSVSFVKAHKRSVTTISMTPRGDIAFSGGKDSRIHRWDVETQKKIGTFKVYKTESVRHGRKRVKVVQGTTFGAGIAALALSDDGKFLAGSSIGENAIFIWDLRAESPCRQLVAHKGPVLGLAFRSETHELFSGSADKIVKIHALDDMINTDTLYGHQDVINSIDSLRFARALSCSDDKTLRLWKVVEEKQLLYSGGHTMAIDCCKMINEERFLSGSQDGSLALWHISRRKPIHTIRSAHGNASSQNPWINSLAACEFSDLVASGSSTGMIKLWKDGGKELVSLNSISMDGFVNDMQFSENGRVLFAGIGQEARLGRWFKDSNAKNGVAFVSLPTHEMAKE